MKTTRSIILSILILFNYFQIYSQENIVTPFEKSKGQETTTYFEGIEFYLQLADQYELTYLETHPKKLGGSLGNLISEKLSPSLEKSMKDKGYEMCPFVNIYRDTPDNGYEQFFDYSRFSTGYAALFQTIGYMSEAHMLKPFQVSGICWKRSNLKPRTHSLTGIFFDSILQQKEHFSDYSFEETAEKILSEKKWLNDSLENRKQIDQDFRRNSRAQLDFIYRNSKYFEESYRQYPVYRILK